MSAATALRGLAGLALALLLGCGASDRAVGEPCTTGASCPAGFTTACVSVWPDGYCTEVACQAGSCPPGSRCVRGLRFTNVPFESFCVATCANNDDCRAGYLCQDVRQPERVCLPAAP